MTKISAFEAKTHFGKLLDRVAAGEEIVITRHDKPIARLIPEGAQRVDEVRKAVDGLRELQEQIRRRSRTKLSARDVRSAIDEGGSRSAFHLVS
jgi:prevent-host-death family protein